MAPAEAIELDELTTEQLCDKVAQDWVRAGGDVKTFLGAVDSIAEMIEFSSECVDMVSEMAENWWMAGGDAELFRRNAGEIRGWIAAHMSAYGKR